MNQNIRNLTLSVISGLLLLGCLPQKKIHQMPLPQQIIKVPPKKILTKPSRVKKVQTKEHQEIAKILLYFQFVKSRSEKALQEEYDLAQKGLLKNDTPINHLRLAILLGFTKGKYRDTKKALILLKSNLNQSTKKDRILRDFSFLLSSFLQSEIQDAERHHKEFQTLSLQLQKEQRENNKRKKMIEELKAIEKSIMKREITEEQ